MRDGLCKGDAAFSAIASPVCMIKTLIQSVFPRKETRIPPLPIKAVFRGNTNVRVIEARDAAGFPLHSLLIEEHCTGDGSTQTVGLIRITPRLVQQLEVAMEAADWCSGRLPTC